MKLKTGQKAYQVAEAALFGTLIYEGFLGAGIGHSCDAAAWIFCRHVEAHGAPATA